MNNKHTERKNKNVWRQRWIFLWSIIYMSPTSTSVCHTWYEIHQYSAKLILPLRMLNLLKSGNLSCSFFNALFRVVYITAVPSFPFFFCLPMFAIVYSSCLFSSLLCSLCLCSLCLYFSGDMCGVCVFRHVITAPSGPCRRCRQHAAAMAVDSMQQPWRATWMSTWTSALLVQESP